MNLSEYLHDRRDRIDQALNRLLPPIDSHQRTVVEAMRYSLLAGGKRIRPILCMAGAEAVGGNPDTVVNFACALEMIHAYSLIHDDLPAMDNDDFRRGIPTNHKRFGDAAAILAGDGLLTEAFSVMTRRALHPEISSEQLLEATRVVADLAGFRGMVGGQMVDIESEGVRPTIDVVQFIHSTKTAALIRASVSSGAILAGGTEESVSNLSRYGDFLGLAFQIRDDLLDVVGTSEEIGKPAGSDLEKNKATYPAVLGIAESEAREKQMVEQALAALSSFDDRAEPLKDLALHLLNRKK